MFTELDFDMFLFFDIETVPEYKSFQDFFEANPKKAEIWVSKQHKMIIEKYPEFAGADPADTYWERAALYAEFNRIVAITLGAHGSRTAPQTNTFYGTDEKSIVEKAIKMIDTLVNPVTRSNTRLWGYYSNRFDVPQLYKKVLMYKLQLPLCFNFYSLKPWETQCKDVYDIWNVMQSERIGSLDLLTSLFNLESPKEDMDGSMVKYSYYHDNDVIKIAEYCNRDVIGTINVLRSMCALEEIPATNFAATYTELMI